MSDEKADKVAQSMRVAQQIKAVNLESMANINSLAAEKAAAEIAQYLRPEVLRAIADNAAMRFLASALTPPWRM